MGADIASRRTDSGDSSGIDNRSPRLRSVLIGTLVVAVAVNAYIWYERIPFVSSSLVLVVQLLGAAAIAYATKALLVKRIHGNAFRSVTMGLGLRLVLAAVMTAAVIGIESIPSLDRWVFDSPLTPIVPGSFLLYSVMALIWLIGYERKTGPVYVVNQTPPRTV
jgi:hypothetical protein